MLSGGLGFLACLWNGISLIVVLSVAATIPILQLASLGYMLESSGRVARGMPVRRCFPGSAIAGNLVACGVWLGLCWLPVWLVADYAYSAELIDPGSLFARRLRVAARIVAVLWVVWAAWALFRGGRWWHFLWPAPMRFLKTLFRADAWREAEDRLWSLVASLNLVYLLKLGFYGAVGVLLWLVVPAALMMVALTSPGSGPLGLIGFVGAVGMWWVLMALPFLPIHMATENRFAAIFDRRFIRTSFRRAPWAFCLAGLALILLALPLYLFRIEAIPQQLWGLLSLFFVLLMFPAKLLGGWALRRSRQRETDAQWVMRWIAWVPLVAGMGVYVGVLYLAKFALWEGTASILLQHAFLPPVPFYLR
jgi:hypothetical protein